jgi:copper(I)-binding protein
MTLDGSPTAALMRGGIVVSFVVLVFFGFTRLHPEPVAARQGTSIIHPWAKGGVRIGGAMPMYVVIENNGMTQERLLGVTSPLADRIVISKLSRNSGNVRDTELDGVQLAPGARLAFRPGELQIMLIGARREIAPGQFIPLVLMFERGGELTVSLRIENIGEPEHNDHF